MPRSDSLYQLHTAYGKHNATQHIYNTVYACACGYLEWRPSNTQYRNSIHTQPAMSSLDDFPADVLAKHWPLISKHLALLAKYPAPAIKAKVEDGYIASEQDPITAAVVVKDLLTYRKDLYKAMKYRLRHDTRPT